jgi:hypothetical protein
MTHDRVGRDDFELSHEFLAVMLGVCRQSVTVVAGTLQRAGLLTDKHGRITVLDRTGLEAASCECYALVRTRFDELGTDPSWNPLSGIDQFKCVVGNDPEWAPEPIQGSRRARTVQR